MKQPSPAAGTFAEAWAVDMNAAKPQVPAGGALCPDGSRNMPYTHAEHDIS